MEPRMQPARDEYGDCDDDEPFEIICGEEDLRDQNVVKIGMLAETRAWIWRKIDNFRTNWSTDIISLLRNHGKQPTVGDKVRSWEAARGSKYFRNRLCRDQSKRLFNCFLNSKSEVPPFQTSP
ncbi:hypothetical protein KFK09_020497 [Dendrobium nobile]|uniref:Uncharacterized protein n=1 Tax=Dendrobium nobile TaxID=94219 RepID=A0A8T3AML1_DENNO|nr:hypothetical protein KFK09_020497 [Dendrobium nobile]